MAEYFYYNPVEQGKEILTWRIYYGDGTTFSSNDGTWAEAPDQDVQVLILFESGKDSFDRNTRFMMNGHDYYFHDGTIFGISFDDITKVKGIVKYGKYMTDEAYEAIRLKAYEDYNI